MPSSTIAAGLSTVASFLLLAVTVVNAQSLRTVTVDVTGRQMRVLTAGLEQRKQGQPVIILEAGSLGPGQDPLDTWRAVLPEIAGFAPVIAYDRNGNGVSDVDREPLTLRRVAQVLHALLQEMGVTPPYVLVGHSWGGNYVRAFFDQYPTEVAGLVFLDAFTGVEPTREEKAAVLPPERRAAALAPPEIPSVAPNTPDRLRAEFELTRKEMLSDGQESRTLRRVSGVPVAIVIATPPGRLKGDGGSIVRLMIKRNVELALSSPGGLLITASHVGHQVQRDDPELVAHVVKHVLQQISR
jgi:pimeloyl-ACP methyl ester carboxylesterase